MSEIFNITENNGRQLVGRITSQIPNHPDLDAQGFTEILDPLHLIMQLARTPDGQIVPNLDFRLVDLTGWVDRVYAKPSSYYKVEGDLAKAYTDAVKQFKEVLARASNLVQPAGALSETDIRAAAEVQRKLRTGNG